MSDEKQKEVTEILVTVETNAEVIEESSKPLDYALDLVQDSGVSYVDWKKRNLGLQLSLLGLAGVQAKRVSTLLNLTQNLEGELLEVNSLAGMKDEEKIKLYEVVSRNQRDAMDFVRQIITGTDWSKIEGELASFQAKKDADTMLDLPEGSDMILQQIVKQLNMVKPLQIQHTNKENKDEEDK